MTIVFGFEYIFVPGTFGFAYLIEYRTWLRWVGALMLAIGISLLWSAHHSLGMSFHSLVVQKKDQELVQTGPYKWICHPIYTAYFFNYFGGGLLASNWVLTFIPTFSFGLMVYLRLGEEEAAMLELFGDKYRQYMKRTGRFFQRCTRQIWARQMGRQPIHAGPGYADQSEAGDTLNSCWTGHTRIGATTGPGKVLSGLNRRIDRSLSSFSIEEPDSFAASLAELG